MIQSRFAQLDPADYAIPQKIQQRLQSPALIVYMDHVRENIRRVIAYCGGDPNRWRPHLKTTKMPAIWKELTDAGIRHFKCATTREACVLLELLDEQEIEADLLVAYPLIGPGLERLGALARAHPRTRISVLSEDAAAVATIPGDISVFADVNPGMNRTGIPLNDAAAIRAVALAAKERWRGVHFYDGHIHGEGAAERRRQAFAGYDRLNQLLQTLAADGTPAREVVTSGTPAFLHALAYPAFAELQATKHRISPGTVVLHDLRTEQEIEELELTPAALIFSRVVSHPEADRATCDAGSKALAAEAGDPCAWVLGYPEFEPLTPSEEHLPLRVPTRLPPRGTPLLLIPRHVCPTINLAAQAILIESGQEARAVTVTARGHELWGADE